MNDSTPAPRLLPEAAYKAPALLFCQALPLALLLTGNIFITWLLHSEMSDTQRASMTWVLASNAALFLLPLYWAFSCKQAAKEVSLKYSAASLGLQIAFLYFVTISTQDLIPEEAALWMIQPERWMGLQYTLFMPGLFYAALRVACFPMRASSRKEIGLSLGLALGVPLAFYLILVVFESVFSFWLDFDHGLYSFFGICFILFCIGATLIALVAILRVLALLYRYGMSSSSGVFTLTLLSALIFPIAGLLLNTSIPFPADFQHNAVYIMTVINAAILLLPLSKSTSASRVLWFFLWFSFPFTLYFFLVFLPWLPLSLFAMIAAGAGFLILAPTLLMIIHCLRIRQLCSVLSMNKVSLVLLALVAFSIIPSAWTLRAIAHRNVLDSAITYTFRPGLEDPAIFPYKPKVLKAALENLNDHYEGKYIPYLTDLYDHLVFNGMTLPKKKMNYMHEVFFGEKLSEDRNAGDIWGMSRNSRMRSRVRLGAPPAKDAVLQQVEWTQTVSNGMVQLEAELTLHNPTANEVEYEIEFDLPPGVWVNGYWLEIEGEEVPGMLVERKTADWIYRMIRDAARRDPGLLRYMDEDTLELRVYPFAANETRRTGIRFTYPVEMNIPFSLGTFMAPANPKPSTAESLQVVTDDYNYFAFNHAGLDKLPTHIRKPYLHLLVDAELLDAQDGTNRIAQALASIPDAWKKILTEGRIAVVDYEAHEVFENLLPLSELEKKMDYTQSKEASGFFAERGITHALRTYQFGLRNKAGLEQVRGYPIVCIISDRELSEAYPVKLDPWLENIPEWQAPWVFKKGTWSNPIPVPQPLPVALFKHGAHFSAMSVVGSWASWWSPRSDVPLEVMQPSGEFAGLEVPPPEQNPLLVAQHESLAIYRDYLLYGSEHTTLREVIETSREASVLLPVSSYIVLENEAQWKMLKLKEKQKLSGAEELELYKISPEPSTWLLMVVGFFLLQGHQKRRTLSKS